MTIQQLQKAKIINLICDPRGRSIIDRFTGFTPAYDGNIIENVSQLLKGPALLCIRCVFCGSLSHCSRLYSVIHFSFDGVSLKPRRFGGLTLPVAVAIRSAAAAAAAALVTGVPV